MTQPHQSPQQKAETHPALALVVALDRFFATILPAITLFHHFFPKIWVEAFNRISRGHQRATRILRAIAEGTYTAPRPHTPGRPRRTPTRPAPYLSRRLNALGLLADWRFRSTAEPLRHLLAAPETIATLAALPAHARRTIGRVLRTPCRLVGAELPPVLSPAGPPRPPRLRARPPQPGAPAAQGATYEPPRRGGKYPRFNPYRYSPGRIPTFVKKPAA